MTKTYSELISIPTFEGRFEYLKLNGIVGQGTFNGHRYLNQLLYKCSEWRKVRREVIIRDFGYDLGLEGYPIGGIIVVHHLNPITPADIIERRDCVFDLENLISTAHNTHEAIHYGDAGLLPTIIERKRNDTCPWRR